MVILCSIDGCEKFPSARGLCQMHYTRLRRHGSPMSTASTPKWEAQLYYHNVVKAYDGNECLRWPYSTVKGYGQVSKYGKMLIVSRLLCEEEYGPPPTDKHQAAHSCGNGKFGCVTKGHLRWATPLENSSDTIIHGRSNRGDRHPLAKLTEVQVREIISLKGKENRSDLSARYGVSKATVSGIHSGRLWEWLDR